MEHDNDQWRMVNAPDPRRAWIYHGIPVIREPDGWYRCLYVQGLHVTLLVGPYSTIRQAAEAPSTSPTDNKA